MRRLLPVLLILAAYTVALTYHRDLAPPGLSNDVAEEALRGIYLVEGHHFEVMTFSLGHSAETLYLYLVGAAAHWFAPTTLALQAVSWVFGLACIGMIWKLAERCVEGVPAWLPVLTAAASIWLFHYARSGLRAIAAPFFLAAFALLLDQAERLPLNRMVGLAAGAVLGLSLYGYTSARILPIAFAAYAGFRLIRQPKNRTVLLRLYGAMTAGALVVSVPNLIFLVQQPKEFLARGNYVLTATGGDQAANAAWTFLMPFYYPDVFRNIFGPHFFSDGVSAGLVSLGLNPIHWIFAIALVAGVWEARRMLDRPVVLFLLAAWITAVVTLGIAGPSLTRLLVIVPAYLVFVVAGFTWLMKRHAKLWMVVLVLVLWVGVGDAYTYFSGAAGSQEFFGAAATPIGQKAASLAAQGLKVVCVVSKDASVVRYLIHRQSQRVRVTEFYEREPDAAEVPFQEFQPDALLIEAIPSFQGFAARFPAEWRAGQEEHYYLMRRPGR